MEEIIMSMGNENVVKGNRHKNTKPIIIGWMILAVLFVALFVFAGIKWGKYVKGQELAIEITAEHESCYETTRSEKAKYYYNYYNRVYPYVDGYDTSTLTALQSKADRSLGEILSSEGYKCYYGSEYLENTNFFQYLWNTFWIIIIGLVVLILFLTTATTYLHLDKKDIVVEENGVTVKTFSGKTQQFQVKDISLVEKTKKGNIQLKGNKIRFKISGLVNRDEIADAIEKSRSL